MLIHKITPSVDYNEELKRMVTQFYKPINQNSISLELPRTGGIAV